MVIYTVCYWDNNDKLDTWEQNVMSIHDCTRKQLWDTYSNLCTMQKGVHRSVLPGSKGTAG